MKLRLTLLYYILKHFFIQYLQFIGKNAEKKKGGGKNKYQESFQSFNKNVKLSVHFDQ